MEDRITKESELLRRRFPQMQYSETGQWVMIPSYSLPDGWNRPVTSVAFQIPAGYPGTPPYGIYTPSGLSYRGSVPKSYTEPAPNQPPFPGPWAVFSWSPADGQWRATSDPIAGCNLLNWVIGFGVRFGEGT